MENMEKTYAVSPGAFDEDPLVTMKRSVYVHPFHEENVLDLVQTVGADRIVFGSDYPHPGATMDKVSRELMRRVLRAQANARGRDRRWRRRRPASRSRAAARLRAGGRIRRPAEP